MAQFIIINNQLMTNNGCPDDKDEIPYISLREFLLDIQNGLVHTQPKNWKNLFNNLVGDMIKKEIRYLPSNLKQMAVVCINEIFEEIKIAEAEQLRSFKYTNKH